MTPGQAQIPLTVLRGDPDEHLFGLMHATGLRIGETLGLQWSDLDSDYRELRVRRQVVEIKGARPYFDEPKSASSKRVVPIIPAAATALHAQRARYLECRL